MSKSIQTTNNGTRASAFVAVAIFTLLFAGNAIGQTNPALPSTIDAKGFDRGTGTGEPTQPVERLLRLMKSADDAYNARNYPIFLDKLHGDSVEVHQIGYPTTVGRPLHRKDLEMWIAAFPDMLVHNDPYDVQFGQGNWTVAIGKLTGTFTKPLTLPGGKIIKPTGKAFNVFFTTIAQWKNDQMAVEYVLFSSDDIMNQIGAK